MNFLYNSVSKNNMLYIYYTLLRSYLKDWRVVKIQFENHVVQKKATEVALYNFEYPLFRLIGDPIAIRVYVDGPSRTTL